MPRSSIFSLLALRKFAGLAAALTLVFALVPRGYMPAVAKAGANGAQAFSFIICQGATPDIAPLLPAPPGKSPTDPAKAPHAGDCPFAPLASFLLVIAAPPVLPVKRVWHHAPPVPRHWNAPGLPFFPRPFGARAPPLSRV